MNREDDELDADDRALVGRLRDLPPEGVEPDWAELEAAIRAQVGERAPTPWWRNWRWIVPMWALATTAETSTGPCRYPERKRRHRLSASSSTGTSRPTRYQV